MDKNQIARVKSCFNLQQTTISNVYCGYVNGANRFKQQFTQNLAAMGTELGGILIKALRKGISGQINKNLFNISAGEKGGIPLLRTILDSDCGNKEAVKKLMQAIADCDLIVQKENDENQEERDGYIIMLASFRTDMSRKNAKKGEDELNTGTTVNFLVCSVCQFSNVKETLSYFDSKNRFAAVDYGKLVATPIAGFLYPAVNADNKPDYKSALYHSKNARDIAENFLRVIFDASAPNTFKANVSAFGSILQKSLDDTCSIDLVRKMRDKVRFEELKARNDAKDAGKRYKRECMKLEELSTLLADCGASAGQIQQFSDRFNTSEIKDQKTYLSDIVDIDHFKVEAPGVFVSMDEGYEGNIRTEYLNNRRCLVIDVDEHFQVTVNGIPVT